MAWIPICTGTNYYLKLGQYRPKATSRPDSFYKVGIHFYLKILPKRRSRLRADTNSRTYFIALVVISLCLDWIPVINRPFLWVETFFHELAHGLMAVLTGGSIVDIQISWDGSGLCRTLGGVSFLVAFAGYLGAQLAGAFIYRAGSGRSKFVSQLFAFSMSVLVVMSAVFLAAGATTLLIHGVLLALFLLPLAKLSGAALRIFIQFVGVFVITNSVSSPIYQLGSEQSDAANLAQLTFIPGFIWVLIWLATGVFIFIQLYRSHRKRNQHGNTKLDIG